MKTANSMHKGLRLTILIVAFSGIAMCNSCGNDARSDSFVRDEMNSVRERTIPSDAVIGSSSDPKPTQYSVIADREFETSEEKAVYLGWVSRQLQHDFKLKTSSESSLVFTKGFGGDSESVSIQTASSNGKLHVRVTNAIYPD